VNGWMAVRGARRRAQATSAASPSAITPTGTGPACASVARFRRAAQGIVDPRQQRRPGPYLPRTGRDRCGTPAGGLCDSGALQTKNRVAAGVEHWAESKLHFSKFMVLRRNALHGSQRLELPKGQRWRPAHGCPHSRAPNRERAFAYSNGPARGYQKRSNKKTKRDPKTLI